MMKRYKLITVSPVSPALGAEVHGIDLSEPLSDDAVDDIRAAFLEYLVLFFRDQNLTREQHVAFGRRFGQLIRHPYVEAVAPEYPEIIPVIKAAEDAGANFGGEWHTDVSFLEEPSMAAILYNTEVPTCGGDTLWNNMYLAYEMLSDGMRNLVNGLRAVHSANYAYGRNSPYRQLALSQMSIRTQEQAEHDEIIHPVVRTHPETGRKCLFVNPAFTVRFEDMTSEESSPLLSYLYEVASQPGLGCRFRWSPDTVAFWDNRCTWHYALNDYDGERRAGERVTIKGSRPV